MSDIDRLTAKYRRCGLLMDANLLLLLFVGLTSRVMVSEHKRTRTYSPDDFDVLDRFVAQFDILIVTPHILTEVVSLAAQCRGPWVSQIRRCIATYIPRMKEEFVDSSTVVATDAFQSYGITDATIALVAQSSGYLVLTEDLKLISYLAGLEVDCINFNHLRPDS